MHTAHSTLTENGANNNNIESVKYWGKNFLYPAKMLVVAGPA